MDKKINSGDSPNNSLENYNASKQIYFLKQNTTQEVNFSNKKKLLGFRIFAQIWFTCEIICIFIFEDLYSALKSFAYCEGWMLILICFYFLSAILDYRKQIHREFCAILNYCALSMWLTITLFFWTIDFPFAVVERHEWPTYNIYTKWKLFSWHIVPVFWLMLEGAWNAHVFKHIYIVFTLQISSVYAVFNCIISLTTNIVIYDAITWRDQWTPLFVSLAAILLITVTLLMTQIKNCITNKCTLKKKKKLNAPPVSNDDYLNFVN